MKSLILSLLLLVLPISSFAHHSIAAVFERDRIIEMEGEVTDILWANPHGRFMVRTSDGEVWELQSHGKSILDRMGVRPGVLNVGDQIRLAGNPARDGSNSMFIEHVLLPSGLEITFSRVRPPRWSDRSVGNAAAWYAEEGDDSRPDLGIFRVWSQTFADPAATPILPERGNLHELLNETARAEFEQVNLATDVPWLQDNCAPKGMPTVMIAIYPFEFVDQGDQILLRQEGWDTVRTIHMNAPPPGPEMKDSLLGHSVGYWDGDTLIVNTTRSNWRWLNNIGIPLAEGAEFVEWFTPVDNGSRLNYKMIVTDPKTFTEPVVSETYRLWIPEVEVRPFECMD